ncbi:hypothetical protein ES705_34039 [subsurface metagenome]
MFINRLTGKLIDDIAPQGFNDHDVYRYGKAFSVKMNISV